MWLSTISRFRPSRPSTSCTAEISMPSESMPIIFLGGQVHDGDAGLAHQLLRLVILVDTAEDHPVLALAVVQGEFQQLLGLLHRFAGQNLYCPEVGLGKGVKIHHFLEDQLDLHVGEVDLLLHRGCRRSGLGSLLGLFCLGGIGGLHGGDYWEDPFTMLRDASRCCFCWESTDSPCFVTHHYPRAFYVNLLSFEEFCCQAKRLIEPFLKYI